MTADANAPDLRDSARLALAEDLQSFVDRHETIFGRVGNIDEQLWTDRSHDVIFDNGKRTATEFGRLIYSLLAGRTAPLVEERFRPDLLDPWIDKVSRNVAAAMVAAMTRYGFASALGMRFSIRVVPEGIRTPVRRLSYPQEAVYGANEPRS